MSGLFELGVIHYTHSVVVIVSVSPSFLEHIEFILGMHLQGHWGDVSETVSDLSDFGLITGTSVTSYYDLVEEFEPLGESLIITTDLQLEVTVIDLSEGH